MIGTGYRKDPTRGTGISKTAFEIINDVLRDLRIKVITMYETAGRVLKLRKGVGELGHAYGNA